MSSGAAVFVIGPAGTGKKMMEHCENIGRSAHWVNMDPAAETFEGSDFYAPSVDIRDLVSVDDVMTELQYGPNGALIFALEYILDNSDWLERDLGGEYRDEFLLIDCPGQIEIYTHSDIMKRIINYYNKADYRTCVVYLLESQWMDDTSKFFAGVLNATAAMLQLETPHINLISKMDLCINRMLPKSRQDMTPSELEEAEEEICDIAEETNPLHRYFFPDPSLLEESLDKALQNRPKYKALNRALVQLVDEFDMVNFIPLNVNSESSLAAVLSHIDHATQYAEQLEPKEPRDSNNGEDDFDYGSNCSDGESALEQID